MENNKSPNEIKSECELLYEQIKSDQEKLKKLRTICPHKNISEGTYSYRPGAINNAIICDDCGELIKYKRIPGFYWVKWTSSWLVAEYNDFLNKWYLPGGNDLFNDKEFNEINETPITPPVN